MKLSFFAVVVLYLAALAVRTSYERLTRAGWLDPKNQTLFLVILLDMILLWASWFALCPQETCYGEAYRAHRARTWL